MKRFGFYAILALPLMLFSGRANATDFTTISENIIFSIEDVPGLISGLSYLLALVLGIMGILKLKEHVEDPRHSHLKEAMIRFVIGGALFSLPMIYEALVQTVDGGVIAAGITDTIQAEATADLSVDDAVVGQDINSVFENIVFSISGMPGLFAGGAYLLGLFLGVSAVLQFKDHVLKNEPELRVPVIKALSAGAMFALPNIIEAMYASISAGTGAAGFLNGLVGGMGHSQEAGADACPGAAAGSIGAVICNLYIHTAAFPLLVKSAAYLFGVVLAIWGILKIKEFVRNPQQTSVWEGVSRLVVGGALFSLPTVLEAVMTSMQEGIVYHDNTGGGGAATGAGLDRMMVDFVASFFGPLDVLLTFFGYVAGLVLVVIGITRLMKQANEGVRGPGGIGTIMTFIAGGALLSFSPMVGAFSVSLFDTSTTMTMPVMQYTAGLNQDEVGHIHAVISAIIKFVLVLGLISFLRGIFIVRSVAEGSHQASMMSGVTHLLGGALAVNLGPFLNAVQATLGLNGLGVNFQ